MNLTYFGLCLACMGVSLGEGMLMNGLLKSVARQPDIISELRSLMILGLPLLKELSSLLLSFHLSSNKEV